MTYNFSPKVFVFQMLPPQLIRNNNNQQNYFFFLISGIPRGLG